MAGSVSGALSGVFRFYPLFNTTKTKKGFEDPRIQGAEGLFFKNLIRAFDTCSGLEIPVLSFL
jgi:hypothetical protein